MQLPHIPTSDERRSLLRASASRPQVRLLPTVAEQQAAERAAQRAALPQSRFRSDEDRILMPYGPLKLSDALIVGMNNIPDAEEIEVVKAAFPAAASVLDRWLANWQKLLENDPKLNHVLSAREKKLLQTEIQWNRDRHGKFSDVIAGVYVGRDGMTCLLDADYYARHLRGRQRNFLHHYVDNAFSFLSLASAQPGLAILVTSVDELKLLYTGVDADGFLTFERLSPTDRHVVSGSIKEKHEDDGKYWLWDPILKGMRRECVEASDHLEASEVLLDMAKRGHHRAFVKAIRSKRGTWTVDLNGVETASDALRNLIRDGFDSSDSFRFGLIVQEHLPTTREQRFFVTNGRIVASVCSDRNLNGTDLREGRLFDERVAIIQRPEVVGGEFERGQTGHEVDRNLAAAFAREARRIVREMRAEGRTHFVLDMGLTARGVVAIEINSFYRSGPYCLDRRRVADAHKQALTDEQRATAARNLHTMAARRADLARAAEARRLHQLRYATRSDDADGSVGFGPDTDNAVIDTTSRSHVKSVQEALESLSFEPQGHVSRQVPHGVSKSSDLPPRDQDREIQDTSDRFATGRPVRRPSMATIRGFLRPKHPTETRSADNVMKALEALQFDPADQASRPRSPPVHSRSSAQPPATAEDEG